MIVYGDHVRARSLSHVCDEIAQQLVSCAGAEPGLRIERARDLLVDCGALCQALQDHEFERHGCDEYTDTYRAATNIVETAASIWDDLQRTKGQCACVVARSKMSGILSELTRGHPDLTLRLRIAEGFAYYGAYPDLHAAAARLLGDVRNVQVIGIRSIGTVLGAVVARTCGTARPLVCVRPVGHPFDRKIVIGPALEKLVCEGDSETLYALADEGPGLSGSSFCSVMRWLRDHAVAADRIIVFPTHAGEPGSAASDDKRILYSSVRRKVVSFDDHFDVQEAGAIASWFEGALERRPQSILDIGGGRWRKLLVSDERHFPPCIPQQERRKFLVHDGERRWIVRYLGLGNYAGRLRRRAEGLTRSGFIPPIDASCHGFSIGPWLDSARLLDPRSSDRVTLLAHLPSYLSFLHGAFPARDGEDGCPPKELLRNARYNVLQLLGERIAARLDALQALLPALERAWSPVMVDGKLDAHEWLVTPDGRLWKTDALDHHAGHDFVGCQDIAWDVAGAGIELGLTDEEQIALAHQVATRASIRLELSHLYFYRLAYASFRAAQAQMAATSMALASPAEAARLTDRASRLKHMLLTDLSRAGEDAAALVMGSSATAS